MKNILLLLMLLCVSTKVKAQKKPNVLIILSDDQGWGDVGFNGGTDIPTPNLNGLAKDGVVFSQGYSSHPYCSPSRAGLLSGRYQQKFGHENNPKTDISDPETTLGLPLSEMLISEMLQKNNYQTCAIGKWHLGDVEQYWPINRGFDDWYGFSAGGMNYWGRLSKDRDPLLGVLRNGKPVAKEEITYLTDDFSREAVNYIDKYSKSEKPFFMYLAYNAPHAPIQATKEYTDKVTHIEEGARAAYAAMVVGMDNGIGKVIDKLKETGEYNNTLIFFYSDNGGHTHSASSAPYRGHKGMLFEGGIREPFLITWPKKVKGGRVYKEPIIALDIVPTILSATNTKKPVSKKLSGVSLLPILLKDKKELKERTLFWRYSGGKGYAVRDKNYKLIYSYYKKKYLLFDMDKDEYEHHDLSDIYPNIVKELKEKYDEWNKDNVKPLWTDPHLENCTKEEKKRAYFINKAQKK